MAALSPGRRIALANKECLVSAGKLFMATARARGAEVLPLELRAQCGVAGARRRSARRGRDGHAHGLGRAVPDLRQGTSRAGDAGGGAAPSDLVHGRENQHRFRDADEQGPGDRGGASSVRPGAGAARYSDPPAIDRACAGRVPRRLGGGGPVGSRTCGCRSGSRCPGPSALAWDAPRLELAKLGALSFEAPDPERFPALRIARAALAAGGAAPTILNAANEVAVEAFLAGRIGFPGIPALVETVMAQAESDGLQGAGLGRGGAGR